MSQIQAWLSGPYEENRYEQPVTPKHVHEGCRPGVPASRRPGTHDDTAQPDLAPKRSDQCGAGGIVLVNQNQS